MKTKEELEKMEKGELVSMVMQLQSNYDLWYNSAQKAERKLEAVKNTISSLVELIG